ncbi:MAG: ABC transporter ATP-binding protein [Candidatus Saliniplasma sp.]
MSDDEERKALSDFDVRELIKRFYREYLRPNLKVYLPIQAGHVFTALLALIPPLILRSIIDDAVLEGDISRVIILSSGALGVFGAIAIGRGLRSYFGHKTAQKIVYDMRNDLYSHFQELPMSFHDNKKTGELISRLIDDLNRLQEFVHHGPEGLLTAITRISGTLIILFFLNVPLTLVSLAFTPLLIIYGWVLMRRMHEAFRTVRSKKADMTDRLEDNLSGVKIIKVFANELFERGRFAEENIEHFEARRKAIRYISILGPGAYFLNSLGLVLTLGYGGYLVMEGVITAGTLAAFYTYLLGFRGPMLRLIHINEGLSRFLASIERFFDHMDIDPSIYPRSEHKTSKDVSPKVLKKRKEDTEKTPSILKGEERRELVRQLESMDEERIQKEKSGMGTPISGRVTFEHVHFSYQENETVLKDIHFDVPAQKSVALVGPSGSGKTTIVRLIPRLYDIDKGMVKVDNKDVRDWDILELRNSIAMVLQDDYLFSGSIKENISYGRPDATEEEVLKMAEEANVDKFANDMPEGYETEVGQRGIKLSGGQRQRISIARALLKDPEILILDEATSSVDTYTEKLIQEAIERVSEGRTTFTIAHRLSTIVDADEILFIEKGQIKERGTFDELMEKGDKFKHFYDLQFGNRMI